MKNILVLLHDDSGQESRFQAALDLTRAVGGHLTCVDVCPPPAVAPASVYGMVEAEAMVFEDARTREQTNRAMIEQRLTREAVSWSMASMTGDIAECLAEHVGLADILVLNRRLDDLIEPDMMGITSKLVLKTNKPILAVPEEWRRFDPFGTAVVAWDGSEPAMTALTKSVPLLALAGSVVIIECPTYSGSSAREAAAYLSRHDIHADVKLMSSAERSPNQIANLIKMTCTRRNATYCVMGAYGHSRIREALFGGVSRAMLKTSPIPLFMAH